MQLKRKSIDVTKSIGVTMTIEEILEAFKQAERDYSRPADESYANHTDCGLCRYFYLKTPLAPFRINTLLLPYWIKYRTKFIGALHFNTRDERLEAIQKVIIDIQNQINEKSN